MYRVSLAITLGVALVATTPDATAQVELKNDGFTTGQMAAFQGGFVTGEEGAVTLVPVGTGPFQVTAVRLLFGGATTAQDVSLHIYADAAGATPGGELFQSDYTLTGSNEAFSEIDLSSNNVFVTGAFRASIEFQHDGLPSIARDDDGSIDAGKNFIKADGGGWFQSSLFGLTGDWVIRADVIDSSGGGAPDAGGAGSGDAGAGSGDAGAGSGDGGTAGGPDAGTGQACSLNSDCPNGQYCGDSDACTFDCRLEIDCASGEQCNEIGQCVARGGGGCRAGGSASGGSAALILLCLVAVGRRRNG